MLAFFSCPDIVFLTLTLPIKKCISHDLKARDFISDGHFEMNSFGRGKGFVPDSYSCYIFSLFDGSKKFAITL